MAAPVPFVGLGQGVGQHRHLDPNTGVRTVVPTTEAKRSSSGWTTTATQAGSSSGPGGVDEQARHSSVPWNTRR